MNLIPDRIGHGTCIHPENGGAEDLVNIVEEHSIPIGQFEIHSIKIYGLNIFDDYYPALYM